MSDATEDRVEEFLSHHGIKGMKWGVRRAENAQKTATNLQKAADKQSNKAERNKGKLGNGMTERNAKFRQKNAATQQAYATKLQQKVDAKTAAKLASKTTKHDAKARKAEAIAEHQKWKKEAGGTEMANKVFQKAAKDFGPTADIINNDPNYKGKDVSRGILGRQYDATMNHYFNEHLAQASVDLTLNSQGHAYIYQLDRASGMMRGSEHRMVVHGDISTGVPDFKASFNELGQITGFTVVTDDIVEHTNNGEAFAKDFIEHFGVKGMHWGTRKTEADGSPRQRGAIRRSITRGNVRRQAIGETIRESGGGPLFHNAEKNAEFHGNVHANVANRISSLNSDARFKGKDLKHDAQLKGEYHAEVKKLAKVAYKEELTKARVDLAVDITSDLIKAYKSSKEQKANGPSDQEAMRLRGLVNEAKHADGNSSVDEVLFSFDRDSSDHIINLQPMGADLTAQHSTDVEDFIAHFGVKGMKWGVRRNEVTLAPGETLVTQKGPGKRLVAQGGSGISAHEEAMRAASTRQRAKASGTHALSNKELQDAITRMNLEKQFKQLSTPEKSAGQKFVRALFVGTAKREAVTYASAKAESNPRLKNVADALQQQMSQGKKKNK